MSITFKNPAFGSSVSLVTNTLTHATAGGKTNQTRYWFNYRKYNWHFDNITREQLNDFLAFAIANAGAVVTMLNEFGDDITGVIDSIITYQQIASGECDLFVLDFVFIGEAL